MPTPQSPAHQAATAQLDPASGAARVLRIGGAWVLGQQKSLTPQFEFLNGQITPQTPIDLSGLQTFDTAGAMWLMDLIGRDRLVQLAQSVPHLNGAQRSLLQLIHESQPSEPPSSSVKPHHLVIDGLAAIGEKMVKMKTWAIGLLAFMGLAIEVGFRLSTQPRHWRFTAFVAHLDHAGFQAIPIVALMNFLIGAVVAFLGASILTDFGASLFTVHLVGFSFLREFGPLLAAIMVAGRTASAFAAQIGAMRANEEVDAIRVMGIDPMEVLVLPRILALLIGLPMLTFLAMMAGVLGGMLVCAAVLDISHTQFLTTFANDIKLRHFIIGLAKAPVFAFLIAIIGCMEGFKAQPNAQSVGEHTTSAVVQSIFIVILVDAAVALVCMEMGW